jgi:hypothetical protein
MPEYQQQLAQPRMASAGDRVPAHVPGRREQPRGLRPSQVTAADRYEREADQAADAIAVTGKNGLRASLSTLRAGPDGGQAVLPDGGQAVLSAGGKPLEGALRGTMQERFGTDFSAVRLHSDGATDRLSEELQAVAFTSGHDIFLGRHAIALPGPARQRLMAHELGHVVQQTTGLSPSRVAAHPAPFVQCMKKSPKDTELAEKRYNKALKKHEAQSEVLRGWIEDGRKSADVLLANSCEWIASGLSILYAATPTGDSDDRVREDGRTPGSNVAYFPQAAEIGVEGGDIYNPAAATYAYLDLKDNSDVTFDTSGTTGWNAAHITPSKVAVVGVPSAGSGAGYYLAFGSRGKDAVLTTVKHEVQHVADRHQSRLRPVKSQLQGPIADSKVIASLAGSLGTGQPYDPGDLQKLDPATAQAFISVYDNVHRGQPRHPPSESWWITTVNANADLVKLMSSSVALLSYKTEYRAYSYEGSFSSFDNTENYNEGVQSRFLLDRRQWTDRQYHIFRKIYEGYPAVKRAWDDNRTLAGLSFQEHVIAYLDPDTEGINKLNSPRIEEVYRELDNIPPGPTGQAAVPCDIAPLLAAIGRLTAADAVYLLNSSAAAEEFGTSLASRLPDPQQTQVLGKLTERALGR